MFESLEEKISIICSKHIVGVQRMEIVNIRDA